MAEMTLPVGMIKDWESFHVVSKQAFGFPDFYGHNNNAWIDCLEYLGDGDGMSKYELMPDERLFIHLPDFKDFSEKCPEIAIGLLECVAAVNSEYLRRGDLPRLVLVPQ